MIIEEPTTTEKMIPEEKAAWVADLRANVGLQGEGQLRTSASSQEPATYCCLGRLCVVQGFSEKLEKAGNWNRVDLFDAEVRVRGLTPAVQGYLVLMNDDEGWDFNQIADWIEENL